MRRTIQIIALVVVIAAGIFAGYKLLFQQEKEEGADIIEAQESSEEDQGRSEAPLPVSVISVERGDLPLRLRISASADAWERANLKTETSGKITAIRVRVGDRVSRNRPLIQLDDAEKKLEVESKRAAKLEMLSKFLVKEKTENPFNTTLTDEQKKQLQETRARYQKAMKDYENGRISESEFENISEEYEQAMIFSGTRREEVLRATEKLTDAIVALKKAQLGLQRATIRSPFPGIVADIMISPGEMVSTGQEVLKLINLNSIYLKGFALESEIQNLKKGVKARIKFDAFPERYFYGRIESISPEVDPEKKTITVFVSIDNSEELIYPGMHAELDIEYQVHENVIKVPRKAVIVRQDRPLVFIVQDDTAIWRYVELGAHNDEEIEIRSGIQDGDLVVVEGQLTLAHQSRVRVTK